MLALIDEWGNPSPGKGGTDWFGFAALLLPEDKVNETTLCYQSVCHNMGHSSIQPIHFRKLALNSKFHITQLLAQEHPQISIVAVRIHEVTSSALRQRGWAYRYYGKEMVRVATHFAADCGEEAQVIFHRHEYLQGIEDYIWKKLKNNNFYMNRASSHRILYDRLTDLRSEDDENEILLSFADCVAHACHTAFNADPRWQEVNPTCLNLLSDCIWQGPSYDRNPRVFGAILQPGSMIPSRLIPNLPQAFRQHWE